jgi:hypothetical protein
MPPEPSRDDRQAVPFLDAPLPPPEVERLLKILDERLRLREGARAVVSSPDGFTRPRDLADDLVRPWEIDPLLVLSADGLRPLAAPFFDESQGGRWTRLAKRVLNLPLRLLARPQSYFNDALRRMLGAWFTLLRASLDAQAVLEHELAEQRRTVQALVTTLEALHVAQAAGGARVALDRPRPGYLHVASRPALGVDVVAKVGALPFGLGRLAELVVRVPVDDGVLAAWHGLLRPGGLLRVVGPGAPALAPALRAARFAPAEVVPDAEELPALRLW